MKTISFFFCLVILGLLSGCVSPRQTYVRQNPSLSPEHRQIILSGKLPAGTAAAGMTKQEVRLAMGSDPAQFTTIDGVYAWIYAKDTGAGEKASGHKGHHHGGMGGGSGSGKSKENPDSTGIEADATPSSDSGHGMQTTIFFKGDRVLHVDVNRA